jgi:hypothetical protein
MFQILRLNRRIRVVLSVLLAFGSIIHEAEAQDVSSALHAHAGGGTHEAKGFSIGPRLQWLRLQGSKPGDGNFKGASYRELETWEALKQERTRLSQDHASALPVGADWFDRESHGYAGIPFVILKALPHLAPDLFGQPEDRFMRFGFLPDDAYPLPQGFGWKTVELCDELGQGRNSPRCAREPARGAINKVTLTCAACHIGQVQSSKDRYLTMRGATNTLLDVKAWRFAFEQLADRYSQGRFAGFLNDVSMTKAQLAAAQEDVRSAIAAAVAFAGEDGLYRGATRRQARLVEKEELALYRAEVPSPAGEGNVELSVLVFRELLKEVSKRRGVQRVLRSRAYSGEGKPRFDFGYPGSTEAAGEALVLVSLLFGEEVDRTSRDQVAPRISQHAGPVDFMNVYNQGHRPESNWDNVIEAAAARTQTAQLATTGTVDQIDLEATGVITNYIRALPPEPYPFAVDSELARRGRDLFDEHCVTCHYPGNRERHGQIATDMNRFNQFNAFTWKATRLALRAACPRESHVESFGEGPPDPCDF